MVLTVEIQASLVVDWFPQRSPPSVVVVVVLVEVKVPVVVQAVVVARAWVQPVDVRRIHALEE
jgi:hypothetical protein